MRGPRVKRRVLLALLTAWAVLIVQATPAQSSGLLTQVLQPIQQLLGGVLQRVDGAAQQLRLPLDTSVAGVVDDVVGALTDTVGEVLGPDEPFTPVGPTAGIPVVGELQRLEVLDGVIEDVIHPHVVQPVADGLAPVVDVAQPVLAPLAPSVDTGVDAVYDGLAGVVSAAGLEAGTYVAKVTTATDTVTRSGVVDVPTALDVNEDGVQDIELEVRVITARPSIRVARLPGAPGTLPIRVEAVIAPGGAEDPSRLAVGFDALDATLPDVIRATLTDDGSSSGEIGVELHSVNPGDTVAVVGSAFTQGASGPIDPTEISVGFTPVPEDVSATLAGALEASDNAAVSLEMSEPSKVDAAIRRTAGDVVEELGATIDKAPESLSIGISQAGNGLDLVYDASAPVDRIALHQSITEPGRTRSIELGVEGIDALHASLHFDPENAFAFESSGPIDAMTLDAFDSAGLVDRATRLRLRIEGIPNDLDADLTGGGFGLDANDGQIDLLEFQLTSGPDLFPPDGEDGLVLRDTPDEYVVAARLHGLKKVTVMATPDVGATLLTTQELPFSVDAITGDTSIFALIDSLPKSVEVSATGSGLHWVADRVVHSLQASLSQSGRTASIDVTDLPSAVDVAFGDDVLSWAANGVTPLVELELRDESGVLGDATSVRARVEELPASLTAALSDDGFELNAGDPIGLIEILATSGPELALPAGVEGIIARNTPTDQVITARVSGVERILIDSDPLTFALTTDHTRVFSIDVRDEAADGSSTALLATIDQLPTEVSFSLVDDGAGSSSLVYTGNSVVDLLNASLVSTDADANTTTAILEIDDLPTALTLDLIEDGFRYTASSGFPRLTLDVTDPSGLTGRATRLHANLLDVPAAASLATTGGRPELTVPNGEIGLLEALLTSGPEISLPSDVDGLYLRDDPTQFVVAIRVTGLRGLSLDEGATAFTLRTTGGRVFDVDALQANETGESTSLLARLDSLPSEISIGLGDLTSGLTLDYSASSVMDLLTAHLVSTTPGEPDTTADIELEDIPTELTLGVDDAGSVTYEASSRLARLSLILNDPAGVFGRATTLNLEALDLPTGLTGELDDTGGLDLSTTGGAIGVVDALLTSGPTLGVPLGTDGIILRDTPAQFVIALHIEELSRLGFATTDDGATLQLGTQAGRSLLVDGLIESEDGASTLIEATLSALPSLIGLSLANTPTTGPGGEPATNRTVGYEASGSLGQLLASLALTDPVEGTTTFGLEATDLPNDLTLGVNADGTVDYTASGTLGELRVTSHDDNGIFASATDLDARLVDLPTHVSIALQEDGRIALDAHGDTLGLLEAKATSSPSVDVGIDDDADGIVLVDRPGEFGMFIRVTGLRLVNVVPGPISIGLGTAGGRSFVVDAMLRAGGALGGDLGDVDIQAALGPLPDAVTLGFQAGDLQQLSIDASDRISDVAFSLALYPVGGGDPLEAAVIIEDAATQMDLGIDINGQVQYAASQMVPLLAIDAVDSAGLFDRATNLEMSLQGLPLALDLLLSAAGAVTIDAHGGTLGKMEARATTGPLDGLPVTNDGVLLEDLPDKFVVFARFTNLRSVTVTQTPLPNVQLDAAGGRPLDIQIYAHAPGKPSPIANTEYTKALLTPAPPIVNLALLPGAPGTLNLNYNASTQANSLTFETNGGDRWLTTASIASPVPTSFLACQAGDRSCIAPGAANTGSIAIIANAVTTINVFDCVRPLNANCKKIGGSPTQFIDVANLRTSRFRFWANVSGTVSFSGNTFIDTGGVNTTGSVNYVQSSTQSFQFTFNSGFNANNRATSFSNVPIPFVQSASSTGSITCSNFSFNVKIVILGVPITLGAKKIFNC